MSTPPSPPHKHTIAGGGMRVEQRRAWLSFPQIPPWLYWLYWGRGDEYAGFWGVPVLNWENSVSVAHSLTHSLTHLLMSAGLYHVCLHVCLHVSPCVCLRVCLHVCVRVCLRVCPGV